MKKLKTLPESITQPEGVFKLVKVVDNGSGTCSGFEEARKYASEHPNGYTFHEYSANEIGIYFLANEEATPRPVLERGSIIKCPACGHPKMQKHATVMSGKNPRQQWICPRCGKTTIKGG